MKNLKLVILACGLVSLVVFVSKDYPEHLREDLLVTLVITAAYLAATGAGALGLARPPMQQWQAIVATSAFGTAFVKLHMWEALRHLGDASLRIAVFVVATTVGMAISIVAIAKPEPGP